MKSSSLPENKRVTINFNNLDKEFIRITNTLRYKNPRLQLSDGDIAKVYHYEQIFNANLLSDDIYIVPYQGAHTVIVSIGLQRKVARSSIGNYGLFFTYVLYDNNEQLIEREFIGANEIDRLQGCKATLEYYDANNNKYSVSNYALVKEYNTKKNLWATKPSEMIKKVAESGVLRKVIGDMHGAYIAEEFDTSNEIARDEIARDEIARDEIARDEIASSEIHPATQPEKVQLIPMAELSDELYHYIIELRVKNGYNNLPTKEKLIEWLTYKYKSGNARDYAKYLKSKLDAH